MDLSGTLAADLTTLTEALGRPAADLTDSVQNLADSMRSAVPSWLGLTMTIVLDGLPLALTILDDSAAPHRVATSAALPLTSDQGTGPGSTIVFYAGTPGAFVDFAADLTFALSLELDDVALDQHLTPPRETSGLSGLTDAAGLNQAIGILIDRGRTQDEATAELCRLTQVDLTTTAKQIIRSTSRQPRPGAA
ncbi:hypothetical protein C7C46_05035 [Streptomyces tateyamensis]|uniref:ANTAR domain-containing protein n=1 Tax=Streptomyces tateyamensis TaxID=565073 RepID=A0A2V4NP73_9ACTN|nr:hypothetical protein [Streptomyces tateyamensis]PYC87337.1 hypothetical protein C7C46_05035 [Streptomyces tateyamensis]